MKRAARGFLILLAVLVLLVGGALWFLAAVVGGGMCQTTIFSQAASAADGLIARTQMTDCGATTGFSRVVIVEKPGLWNRECRALAIRGEPGVKLAWVGSKLRISHDARAFDVIAQSNACFGHAIQIFQER